MSSTSGCDREVPFRVATPIPTIDFVDTLPSTPPAESTGVSKLEDRRPPRLLELYLVEEEMKQRNEGVPQRGSPFRAVNVNAPSRPRTLVRDDLDMNEQQKVASLEGRAKAHAINCDHFKSTCASRSMHQEFVKLLLAEADHYQFGDKGDESRVPGGLRARQKLQETLRELDESTTELLEESENKYSKALLLVSNRRLFSELPHDWFEGDEEEEAFHSTVYTHDQPQSAESSSHARAAST